MYISELVSSGVVSLLGITVCSAADVCLHEDQQFYCDTGCCGNYRDHHCCSQTGLIVGIVVCVAVIVSIVVIYCYMKHRNRKRAQANMRRPLPPCPHGQPIGMINCSRRGPATITGPAMPAYPPPYDFTVHQPPSQPKEPPPAYDSVYRTSAGIGGASNNASYPPPVS